MADVNTTATDTQATEADVQEQAVNEAVNSEAKQAEKTAEPETGKTPDLQEMMTEIARLKRKADKADSEAAEWKRKYRSTLSEKENLDAEKAEREAEREEQFKQLLRENQINKLEKTYMGLGYTVGEASKIAAAEVDNDFDAKAKIMAEVDARKKKEYEAEWLKNRPPVNAGAGDNTSISKKEFDAMTLQEKSKLKRENEVEYNRLIKL